MSDIPCQRLNAKISFSESNKVKVEANYIGDNKKHLFSFRIRCNGIVKKDCTPWSETSFIIANINEPGFYSAEVWINISDCPKFVTNSIFCVPNDIEQKYKKFLKNFSNVELPKLELYKRVYPFGDIAVIHYMEKISLDKIEADFMHYDYAEKNLHVITSGKRYITEDVDYIFLGITRNKDNLLVGDKDFYNNNVSPKEIDGQIGEFCLFYKNEKEYKLISDYFGFNRIYYYQGEKIFIACNSYHMLIIILKQLGVSMSLNIDKIKASLSDVSTIFETNFCFETDINEINLLPIDKCVVFSDKQPVIQKTELYDVIRDDKPFDEKEYENLIFQGINEVTDNLRISLEHNNFDYVRMDLSGGMDSRLLYGAATRLPNNLTQKLRIRTDKKAEKDFSIANTINSIYRFKYDNLPEKVMGRFYPEGNLCQSPISIDLDGYYTGYVDINDSRISMLFGIDHKIEKTLHLTGGAGEIVGRPFMRYFFSDVSSIDELCNLYSNRCGNIVVFPNGYNYFSKKLKETMEYLPGRNILEKFDNHNLYFRNGYHFKLSYYSDVNCIGWTPLQSKACFKAKIMAWSNSVNMKPQFDFLNLMNPLISQIPYASDRQNNEKNELQANLYNRGYPKANVSQAQDTTDFDKAWSEKLEKNVYEPNKEKINNEIKKYLSLLSSDEAMLTCLKSLINADIEMFSDLGIYLFSWITCTSHTTLLSHQRAVLNKRLLTLYYQIKILENHD